MLFSVHESVTNIIIKEFSVIKKSFSETWDFDITSNQNFKKFARQYSEFFKTSDFTVKFTDLTWSIQSKFIVKIDFSETYEQLVKNVKLWLKNTNHIIVIVLMKFIKILNYQSSDFQIENLVNQNFFKTSELNELHFTMNDEYDSVSYKKFRWVRVILKTFLKVWKRNLTTKLTMTDEIWSV